MSANDLMVLLTIGAAGLSLLAIAYAATLWAFRKDHPENARQAREWLTAAAVMAIVCRRPPGRGHPDGEH